MRLAAFRATWVGTPMLTHQIMVRGINNALNSIIRGGITIRGEGPA